MIVVQKHSLLWPIVARHDCAMTHLSCRTCAQPFPADASSLVSLHHTTDGLVGYARCPTGHVNVVNFHARIDAGGGDARRVDAA
jgi:hypothetical protein